MIRLGRFKEMKLEGIINCVIGNGGHNAECKRVRRTWDK